jgi:hypothetical protein
MTNHSFYQQLCERGWRRKPTAAEAAEVQAWLAAHPEARADWEAEAGLSEALGRLADAPVASNFTARVLAAVERASAEERRRRGPSWQVWRRWRWLPRVAFAGVVLSLALVSYERVAKAMRRAEYARSVTVFSEVSSLPSPEVLKDFDAIRVLEATPRADEELLAALK